MTKLYSWNVNGLRAALKKSDFPNFLEKFNPDILCLQETKCEEGQAEINLPQYPHQIWNSSKARKGYSGTAVFSKIKPLAVTLDMNAEEHDKEGRVITCEFENYFLVNVYTPNSGEELARLDYRVEWDKEFFNYLKKLEKKKPVVVCGDLNVAHTEIDLANPKTNKNNAGFTDAERDGIRRLLNGGFLDTFRVFNQEPNQYSWWSYRFGARARNVGWRIDYFLASQSLKDVLQSATIHQDVMGSDHCPVGLILK